MDEAKKSTSKAFFDKFTHNIRPKVEGSLDYSFTCKWSTVEEAFYASVGEEQVVPLYSAFFKEGIIPYWIKPMDQVIGDISSKVDKT